MSKKRGFFGLFKRKKSKEEVQQEESFATEEFQQDNNSIQEEFQPDDVSAEEEKENQQENIFVTEEFQQDNISLGEKLRQESTPMEEDFQQENRFVEEELQRKDTFMEKESQQENGSVQEEVQQENSLMKEQVQQDVEEQEETIQVNSDENNLLLEETQTEELLDSTKKKKEKKGFFKKLVEGLAKTRNNIAQGFDSIFSGFSSIDDDFYEELEEILIMADLGVATTTKIIEDLQAKVKEQKIKEPSDCKQLLIESIKQQMQVDETAYDFEDKTSVVLLIGVNGVGKTTSVGKLAGQMKQRGKKVMVAAADTFRAAAIEQLTEWAKRANVEIIAQQEGSDPAAVVFDAVTAAKSRNTDILFCDTAGRLHNKKNLMEELRKINRVIDREYPDAYRETLVVLDGTTGQNALAQAKQFNEVAEITGIVLTKLDGTAKGGIAIAIQAELGIPVKYIGIGEKIEDLQRFDADAFVNALFDVERLEEE